LTSASSKAELYLWNSKLVWADSRKGKDTGCGNCPDNRFDIYLYDFASGREKPIIESPYLKTEPSVYENKIVWSDYRNRQADIYLFDLKTNRETRLTQSEDNEERPLIYKNKVVWSIRSACDVMGKAENNGVYVYDLGTKRVEKITDYVEPRTQLHDNLLLVQEGCWRIEKIYGIYLK